MSERISRTQLYWYDSDDEIFKSLSDDSGLELDLFIPKVELYWYDTIGDVYKPLVIDGKMPISEDIMDSIIENLGDGLLEDVISNIEGRIENLADISLITDRVNRIDINLENKADKESPNLIGIPTAPTAPVGTSTEQIATTAFVIANANTGTGGNVDLSEINTQIENIESEIEGVSESIKSLTPSDILNPDDTIVEVINETREIPVAFTLLDGFHASSSGAYSQNNGNAIQGWRTGNPLAHTGTKTYKLVYDYNSETPSTRVLRWNGDTYLGSEVHPINAPFTISEPTTRFTFNLSLPGATPNTTPALSAFSVLEGIQNVRLVSIEQVDEEVTIVNTLKNTLDSLKTRINELAELSGAETSTLKVLMIGNSFSEDVSNHIHNIARSAGVNVIFGNAYRVGETLQGHWNQISTNANGYVYHRRSHINNDLSKTSIENISFRNILIAESWDIVTYQQGSPQSGQSSTFQPYLDNIINYVNTNKTNPNLKHALHMTWAYPTTSTETGFANYGNDQITMYNAIVNAYQQVMEMTDIDLLIPVGTAIQNARLTPQLKVLDNDMASDGFHLGDMGDYIGALTVFETLIADKYKKSLIDDVSYTVTSKFLSSLAKIAVKNAMMNPYNMKIVSMESHMSDYMSHDSSLSQYSSDVDTNGFYRVVEYKREDNTLHMKSTASNPNDKGLYQTIVWQFYAKNGITIALTKTWIVTYDINGVVVSKVLS